jgi:hypothetical protein
MIVLLEGCDGSGKTTLGRRIETEFNMPYMHVSSPKGDADVFIHHYLPAMEAHENVIDRLHWSEDVYGAVNRGGSGLTAQEFGFIDGILHSKHTLVILCTPPLSAVLLNIEKAPGFENHDTATATMIWHGFNDVIPRTRLPIAHYDYTSGGATDRILADLRAFRETE